MKLTAELERRIAGEVWAIIGIGDYSHTEIIEITIRKTAEILAERQLINEVAAKIAKSMERPFVAPKNTDEDKARVERMCVATAAGIKNGSGELHPESRAWVPEDFVVTAEWSHGAFHCKIQAKGAGVGP